MVPKIDSRKGPAMGAVGLAPADLMLSKLQIHALTRNDVIGLCVHLCCASEIDEPFALEYLGSVLAHDWGFCLSAAAEHHARFARH